MQKYTFVVDVVSDSAIDANAVRASLLETVDGIGTIAAVHPVKSESLKEQGYKVWAKRVAGVSLATPKVKKVKPVKVEAEVATATA